MSKELIDHFVSKRQPIMYVKDKLACCIVCGKNARSGLGINTFLQTYDSQHADCKSRFDEFKSKFVHVGVFVEPTPEVAVPDNVIIEPLPEVITTKVDERTNMLKARNLELEAKVKELETKLQSEHDEYMDLVKDCNDANSNNRLLSNRIAEMTDLAIKNKESEYVFRQIATNFYNMINFEDSIPQENMELFKILNNEYNAALNALKKPYNY
jgi:uncharacterized protein YqgV (UPF0045/DUF77 family)